MTFAFVADVTALIANLERFQNAEAQLRIDVRIVGRQNQDLIPFQLLINEFIRHQKNPERVYLSPDGCNLSHVVDEQLFGKPRRFIIDILHLLVKEIQKLETESSTKPTKPQNPDQWQWTFERSRIPKVKIRPE